MKLIATILLLLLIALHASSQEQSTAGPAQDSVQSELKQLADTWLHAYNGGDAQKLAPLYAKDAQYISSHAAGLVADGKDRLITNFQKGMSGGGHLDSLEVLSVNVSCDLATVLCTYHATNSGQKASGRTLLVLKKMDKKWLIVLHMTVV